MLTHCHGQVWNGSALILMRSNRHSWSVGLLRGRQISEDGWSRRRKSTSAIPACSMHPVEFNRRRRTPTVPVDADGTHGPSSGRALDRLSRKTHLRARRKNNRPTLGQGYFPGITASNSLKRVQRSPAIPELENYGPALVVLDESRTSELHRLPHRVTPPPAPENQPGRSSKHKDHAGGLRHSGIGNFQTWYPSAGILG